jgi:DNA-binding GntR family transcriptional regulator
VAIHRQVLRAEVEEMILQKLLSGHYQPGARLSIDGLARELEVSPTPVREAMVALERSGLVSYQALRGYVVAPMLTPGQINELVDAREIIETAAMSRAFEHWDELADRLGRAHEAHARIVEKLDETMEPDYDLVNEHFQADWGFHQAFFTVARNTYLDRFAEDLRSPVHRMRQTWQGEVHRLDADDAFAEHSEILRNVLDHNHDGTLRALRRHLEAVRGRSVAQERDEEAEEGPQV